ncbi:hypothetical protein EJB05_23187, partial [Eragrostis curvula]
MSAFAWACISEGLNPEPYVFYRVYQARHIPTYDHENHLSPCFEVVEFEAREGFLTPLGSFDPPAFDEWVKDWFYYKYSAIDFYTRKAAGIWIINNFEPPQNQSISRCVDAFRRVSQRMTLRDILEECFDAGVLPLARHGWRPSSFGRNKFGLSFNLWSPQNRVTSFLGKFSQKEWVERSSTVEMDPSLVVVTPEVESVPRNAEIPSPQPGHSSSGSVKLDVEAMLSSIKGDIQASDPLESAIRKVRFPKAELGLSNLSSDILFRSFVAHQVKLLPA